VLLELQNISKTYSVSGKHIFDRARDLQAVADVSIAVAEGRSLGLVGESGCGKSTLAKIAAGFVSPTRGNVTVDGKPLRDPRGGIQPGQRVVQMVFQDPLAALDSRMTVGDQIDEAVRMSGLRNSMVKVERNRLLDAVGLVERFAGRLPHEISGGQRQRIVIARALAAQPKLLICDEPLAALDVSVQAQILSLFSDLKREFGLSLLFISHQLSAVRLLCDDVAVMYAGRIIEQGTAQQTFESPQHPYSRMLLSTALDPRARSIDRTDVKGEPPNPLDLPKGCPFNPRCSKSRNSPCRTDRPKLENKGNGRQLACYFPVET